MVIRHAFGIVNPVSGQSTGSAAWSDLAEALSRRGVTVDHHETTGENDAARRAESLDLPDDAVVVAVGGDGTVQEVVDGLMRRPGGPLPLTTLATGTANVFSRCIRISDSTDELAAKIAEGSTRSIDVGRARVGDELTHFLIAAGLGIPALVIERSPRHLKDQLGWGAYAVAAVGELARLEPSSARVTLEWGERRTRLTTASLVVTNVGRFAGDVVRSHPETLPNDRMLDVVALRSRSTWMHVKAMIRVLLRQHRAADEVFLAQAPSFTVHAHPPLPVQVDGESIGETPVTFDLADDPLTIVGAS